MRHAILAISATLLLGCGSEQPVPENTLLWRLAGWKPVEGGARVATATIVTFRSSGEYVELHTRVIEQPDTTVYIASDAPRLTMVGTWTRQDDTITARRQRVLRPTPFRGPRDPLCDETPSFRIDGRSVIGQAVEPSIGSYSPVTRLVAPEFESYVGQARESGAACAAIEN